MARWAGRAAIAVQRVCLYPTTTGLAAQTRIPGRLSSTLRESTSIAADVKVAEGDGAGVGDVVGLGESVQAELGHDRVLDLGLGGPAVAGEGLLDPRGGVAEDRRLRAAPRPARSPRARGPSGSPCAGSCTWLWTCSSATEPGGNASSTSTIPRWIQASRWPIASRPERGRITPASTTNGPRGDGSTTA